MATAKKTTDHETIRRWIEERGGQPATVRRTADGDEPGILRVDFPEHGDEDALESLFWDEFYRKFDESGLAFLYDPDRNSRFSKFVRAE
jgi:hypothetical protein